MSESGLHRHEHEHAGVPPHRHVHHHAPASGPHDHRHTTGFERFTYLASPVHALDGRTKVLSALVVLLAVVLTPPMRAVEFALVIALLLAVAALARLPLAHVLARTALVLPFAGALAIFAPFAPTSGSLNAGGIAGAVPAWQIAVYGMLSKAWLGVFCMVLLSFTTPVPELLRALRRFRVPSIFILLLSFAYRYVHVVGEQVRSTRTAAASRAPSLERRRLLALFGNLAGSMVVRSFERGERVHAAMLARGFDGTLPTSTPSRFRGADALFFGTALLTAAAIALA